MQIIITNKMKNLLKKLRTKSKKKIALLTLTLAVPVPPVVLMVVDILLK